MAHTYIMVVALSDGSLSAWFKHKIFAARKAGNLFQLVCNTSDLQSKVLNWATATPFLNAVETPSAPNDRHQRQRNLRTEFSCAIGVLFWYVASLLLLRIENVFLRLCSVPGDAPRGWKRPLTHNWVRIERGHECVKSNVRAIPSGWPETVCVQAMQDYTFEEKGDLSRLCMDKTITCTFEKVVSQDV